MTLACTAEGLDDPIQILGATENQLFVICDYEQTTQQVEGPDGNHAEQPLNKPLYALIPIEDYFNNNPAYTLVKNI